MVGPRECAGEDVSFTFPPVPLEDTEFIEPMGKLHGGHVTPTAHTYVRHTLGSQFRAHLDAVLSGGTPLAWDPPFDVLSPAGGYITEISAFPFGPAPFGFTGIMEDYLVLIWHSCAVSTFLNHLAGLAPEILAETGEIGSGGLWLSGRDGDAIPVSAGQVIGKVGDFGIDFSVQDIRVMLEGFVVPEHYASEVWTLHTVDPYAYFAEPLRSQLLDKSPRTAEPRGGQIDYDIEGRLVGNWFLEGTGDYSGGVKDEGAMCGTRPCPYWTGHLSFAYDYIDPSQVRISIGAETGIIEERCWVCQGAYGVRGNGPDPATIDAASGLVKYELVERVYVDEFQVATENVDSNVLGVFLVQVLDDRSIKVEVVAGSTAAQLSGFSPAAVRYFR